jgi:hypothetical protein
MRLTLNQPAKPYKILRTTVYIYRRVLDEIGFPTDDRKRFNFTTGLGEFEQDKIVIKDENMLKNIMGEDYRPLNQGYMFVTEEMKQMIIEKYNRVGA